mgnify:CR=1 FL=1
MKKINTLTMMILLTYSFSIAQELEVEGDLKVTGTVESATIDSLEQAIANMQVQIAELQAGGEWETRIIEHEFDTVTGDNGWQYLTINELLGINIEMGSITLLDVENFNYSESGSYTIYLHSYDNSAGMDWNGPSSGGLQYEYDANSNTFYTPANQIIFNSTLNMCRIKSTGYPDNASISGTLKLLVTAQFPD